MTSDGFIAPVPTEDTAPYWGGLVDGELLVQHCPRCDTPRFPPRPMCGRCRTVGSDWRAVAPYGTVWSFIVVHPPVLPAFADQTPFNVVVVQLDADPSIRMVGNLVHEDGTFVPAGEVVVGDRVELAVVAVGDGVRLPRWRVRR